MGFYVKESIATGYGGYLERALRTSPLKELGKAKALCDRSVRNDNEPYVVDEHRNVVYTGKRGKDYK